MRLTAEQVRQGLMHDDKEVRQRCLEYFTDQWCSDGAVMETVVDVIDARGKDAFRFFHDLDQLTQTGRTVDWVIRSLRQTPDFFADRTKSDFRPYILMGAKGELLRLHRDDVLSVLAGDDRESVERRLQFLSEPPAVLWERLESLAEQHKSAEEWDEFPHAEADDLVACLAELGSIPIERMMELLQTEIVDEDEDSALIWLEPKLIRLAGLIRHQPALPILVEKLRIATDSLNEECQMALIRLGTDDVVRTIANLFPDEEWAWQLFASSAFENIHSDETVGAATALLQIESLEEDIRQHIAHGLANQFSTDGLQTLADYLDSRDDWLDNPEWSETLPLMRVASQLLQVELPRLEEWESQMDAAIRSGRATLIKGFNPWDRFDDGPWAPVDDEPYFEAAPEGGLVDDFNFRDPPPATVVHETPRVGRNDPCPCGSGKKFKKCCQNKEQIR